MTAITLTKGSWYLHRDGTRARYLGADHTLHCPPMQFMTEDFELRLRGECSDIVRDLGKDYRPDVIAPGQVFEIGKAFRVVEEASGGRVACALLWSSDRSVRETLQDWPHRGTYLGTLGPRGLYGVLARLTGVE